MPGMDPQLAAIYGTNQDESDVEKLAAAELAEKLAGDEETEVSDLTDEQAEELAQKLLEEEAAEVEEPETEEAAVEEPSEKTSAAKTDEAEEGEEMSQEAQEKLAEADYLGRVMAHAYAQELRKIAAAGEEKPEKAEKVEPKAKTAAKGGKVASFLKAGAKKVKKAAAETEVAEAKPSALDTLAARRAEQILKENGIELQAEEKQEEKTSASDEEKALLAQKVEARAVQMLTDAGYTFEQAEEKVEEEKAE